MLQNAFSKLTHLGFNIYSTLVVDLMHEFELGVWKALFIHLIRLLEAHDRSAKDTTVAELDRRWVVYGNIALHVLSECIFSSH